MTSILDRFRTAKVELRPGGGVGELAGAEQNEDSRHPAYVVTRAEQAPCTCPEFCERDHENE
jgi:hypothetical protein